MAPLPTDPLLSGEAPWDPVLELCLSLPQMFHPEQLADPPLPLGERSLPQRPQPAPPRVGGGWQKWAGWREVDHTLVVAACGPGCSWYPGQS